MSLYDGINDKFTLDWLLETTGVLVDAYVVGRMFRSFNNGPDPRYIIVYLGDWHINGIKTLFDRLGFYNVGNNTSNIPGTDFQCLRIGLKTPFFH